MTEEIELKPCPFCGGKAVMIGEDDGMYQVVCPDCAGTIDDFYNEKEVAAEKWNERKIEDAMNKEVERFKRYALSLEDEIKSLRKSLKEAGDENFNATLAGVLRTDRARLTEALELIQKTGQEKPFDGNACAYIAELALSGKRATVEWQKIEKEINKEEDEMNLKGGKQ